MGSPTSSSRIVFRVVIVALLLLLVFYIGRPLYWKISATVHDIRNNKQTVRQGLSQIVMEAQKSVGWYHDESDSGARAANRKLLLLSSYINPISFHYIMNIIFYIWGFPPLFILFKCPE